MATQAPTAASSANTTSAEAAGTRLRILLALEAAGGGAGRHVHDLAAGLLRRNHNVCLVYSPARAEPVLLERLQALPGLSLHPLAMQRAVGPADAVALRALRDLLDRIGPFDILHGHSSKAGALLRLAARQTGTPCLYTPHAFITLNPELDRARRFVYGNIERWLARYADRIICVSQHELRHAHELGIPAARLRLVPNGIQPLPRADRDALRAALGLGDDAICVGSVGRLTAQKAMDRLLSAFAMAAPAGSRTRLLIVGDGPDRAALEQQAARLGISRQLMLAGAADGARLMAAFDLFALSSRYEAGPYVLLEAAARGLPIVMTPTGGAGEIVRDGFNGRIAASHELEDLAACLRQLLSDPARRRLMGQHSAELASRFSAERMVEETLAVYRELLPSPAVMAAQ